MKLLLEELNGKKNMDIVKEIENNGELFDIDLISYDVRDDVSVKKRELSLK